MKRWMVPVGLLATLLGCAGVPRSTEPPRVRVETLELLPSSDPQRFVVTLLIDNLSEVLIPVEELRFSMRLAGEGVVSGRWTAPFSVEPLDVERVEMLVSSDRVSSRSRLTALAEGPSRIMQYELEGELVIGGRPPRSLPFSTRSEVPLSLGAEP